MALDLSFERLRYQLADLRSFLIETTVLCYFWQQRKRCGNMALAACLHRAGQRCFELLALIGSPQLSFQRYSQLNKHLGLTGKPYWLAQRQML